MSSDSNQLIIQTLPENITSIQRKIITDDSVGPSDILIYVQYIVETSDDMGTGYINSAWRFRDRNAKGWRINNSSKSKELAEKSMFEVMTLEEFAIKSDTVNVYDHYAEVNTFNYGLRINKVEQGVMTGFFRTLNQIYERKTNSASQTLTGFLLDVAQRRQNDTNEYLRRILDQLHTR